MVTSMPGGEASPRTLTGTPAGGLSSSEVEARRASFGYNEVVARTVPVWRRVLRFFWGPIPAMIEVALLLSVVLGNWDDFALILALLVANALVGFWEEYQSGNAVAALQAHLAPRARVLRDGAWRTVPARELVPGDVVRLRLGDIVPADAELEGSAELELDQSALTGESLPVTREGGGTVYSGSIVRRGEASATVTKIGAGSFLGRTTELVATARSRSHLQAAILRIGDVLIVVALSLAVLIEVVSLVRGVGLVTSVQFALVLAVAAIPVAMPTVLSVTMAVGARTLAKESAIVTRLESVEELAGVDILCSDKTGTLTQNRLRLGEPAPTAGVSATALVAAAALASRIEDHDPIDDSILADPRAAGAGRGLVAESFRPFDPSVKRTEATYRDPSGRVHRVAKGAAPSIVALARPSPAVVASLDRSVEAFAQKGYRSLAVASAEGDGPWQVLGVLPLFDPLRPDSAPVIRELESLGIGVKMVTGDQVAIARETARELGLRGDVVTPETLGSGPASAAAVESAAVFAQVLPEDKFSIVERLQHRGHLVGMTGDGVNDAPALKKADTGIAVSGATDAARAAASVVLVTPGLGVILTAVRQARQTFARMTAYAIYRIEETIRLLLFIATTILVLGFFPVTALEIVLIALLNDGAILAIAYDRTPAAPRPVSWRLGRILVVAVVLGVLGVVSTFVFLSVLLGPFHVSGPPLQTLLYLKLSVAGHFVIFLTRTEGPFYRSRPAGVLVAAVVGTQLLASAFALTGFLVPAVPPAWVLAVWGWAGLEILLIDPAKRLAYRLWDRRPPADRASLAPSAPGRLRRFFGHRA